jgi:cytochrome P450
MPSEDPADATASGWDVYAIAVSDDPHGQWRRLREAEPVLDAGDGVYFVTRWDLVDAVLRDPRHRAGAGVSASFGATGGLAFDVMRAWLMSLDGPEQTRARGLVRREFTPRQVERLRPGVARVADELCAKLEATASGGSIDLIESLAFALPSEVTRSLFGIDGEDWREVERILRSAGDGPDAGIAMIEALARYFDARVRADACPPGLLAQLQRPDERLGELSPLEVVANAVLLVTAAIDTTAGLIGNAALCLLERPELLRRIRAAPSLVAAAIEETLRFEPPALSCSRRAGVPCELAGVAIAPDSQLLLGLAAANRDPARHPDPDRFDLERDHTGLLSFGGGRHFCLGAALARLEARVAIERLLVRSPVELELVEPPRWQRRNPTVRSLERLPVRLRMRGA